MRLRRSRAAWLTGGLLALFISPSALGQSNGMDDFRESIRMEIGRIDLRSVQIGLRDEVRCRPEEVADRNDADESIRQSRVTSYVLEADRCLSRLSLRAKGADSALSSFSRGEELVGEIDEGLRNYGPWLDRIRSIVRIDYETMEGKDDICTGIFVSATNVLTAGHCGCGKRASYEVRRTGGSDDLNPFTLAAFPSLYYPASCTLPGRLAPGFDLALLTIAGDEISTAPIVPISPMQVVYQDQPVTRLTIGGFGYTDEGTLAEGTDPFFGHVEIRSHFCTQGQFGCRQFREFILADPQLSRGAPTDSCGGDSGGPVFYTPPPAADGSQEIVLVGIVSRAIETSGNANTLSCGGGGIYTALGRSQVVDWMRSNGVDARMRLALPPDGVTDKN